MHPNDPDLKTYENMLPGMTAGLKVDDQHKGWIGWLKKKGYPADLHRETVLLPEGGEEIHTSAPSVYRREHSDSVFLTDTLLEWFSTREEEDWFVHLPTCAPILPGSRLNRSINFTTPKKFRLLFVPQVLKKKAGNIQCFPSFMR